MEAEEEAGRAEEEGEEEEAAGSWDFLWVPKKSRARAAPLKGID